MRCLKIVVPALALCAMSIPALAQDDPGQSPPPGDGAPRQRPPRGDGAPPGGEGRGERGGARQGPLSPEKAKAAWELEAKGVAKSLGLNADQTTKVIAAYTEARTSNAAAMEKMRSEMRDRAQEAAQDGGDDGGREQRQAAMEEMQKKIAEARKADTEKLSTALAKDLSSDQVTKAMKSLGTFNPSWDNMVNAIAEFNLGEEKTYQALTPIENYVIAVDKVRESTDMDARRTAMTEARDSLNDSMKKILSEEQMGKFTRTVGGGRGAGMGGAPGGGGRGARGGAGSEGGAGGGGRGGSGGGGSDGGAGGGGQ